MSMQIIKERLQSYSCRTALEEHQAVREITQEVALAALGRGDFFKHALFQGGTCLRIFHGLNRFSEDLDFILRQPDSKFELHDHLKHLTDELAAYGYDIEITDRADSDKAVRTAFLKDQSLGKWIELRHKDHAGPSAKIRVKLEVDTRPPSGSGAELKYLDFPFVSAVAVQDIASLFAGKLHALLCRKYVKGRDWYDFIWYTSRHARFNEAFLASALRQLGPWQGQNIIADTAWVKAELEKKIVSVDWQKTAGDVSSFVRATEQPSLDLWSRELFLQQLDKLGGHE